MADQDHEDTDSDRGASIPVFTSPPPVSPNTIWQEDLASQPWFHGHLSRNQASMLAEQVEDGVFLLRFSANQQYHVLTVSYKGKAKVC